MTKFDVNAVLETICVDRGWELKPVLCHYIPPESDGVHAVAQWSTIGEDTIKIGSYNISVGKKSLEYSRSINREFDLVDPTSITKINEIFQKIEDEVEAMRQIWPWFVVEDRPWDGINKALRHRLTQQAQDGLIKVER